MCRGDGGVGAHLSAGPWGQTKLLKYPVSDHDGEFTQVEGVGIEPWDATRQTMVQPLSQSVRGTREVAAGVWGGGKESGAWLEGSREWV